MYPQFFDDISMKILMLIELQSQYKSYYRSMVGRSRNGDFRVVWPEAAMVAMEYVENWTVRSILGVKSGVYCERVGKGVRKNWVV